MHLLALFVPFTTEVNDFPTFSYTWGLKKTPFWAEFPRIGDKTYPPSSSPGILMRTNQQNSYSVLSNFLVHFFAFIT